MKLLQVLALITSIGLSSCSPKNYEGVYESHHFVFKDYVNSNTLSYNNNFLDVYSNKNKEGFLRFTDYSGDWKFDSLSLVNVSDDDPLRNFTCLEIGNKIIEPFINKK